MDNHELFWLLASVGFIFSALFIKVVVVLWLRPRKIQDHFGKQGIRGPPYNFFFGNVKQIMELMLRASSQPMSPPFSHNILPRVLPFYHHWKKIYGATFLVWFGSTARLTVADSDLIREIFVSKSEFYEKTEAHPLIKQLEGDGLLSLKGENWARHRKIISPNFHMENLKLMVPAVAGRVSEMLDRWWEISKQGDVEIEVSEWFQNLTEDVITMTVFGNSYEDGKAISGMQNQQMLLASDAFRKVFIPGYRFLPTRKNLKSWKLDKEIKKSIIELIDLRRENLGKDEDRPKDLLGLMIQASFEEGRSASLPMSYSDIIEECKSFFFAGKHTTSNLLTWTTVLLAMHPSWQLLARDEVFRVCGSRDPPTKDEVVKLKTLSMIVNESLRLYPPTVATIRRAKADVELGIYKVPLGTELLIPILALHQDKATWGNDADVFNPARFAEGVARAAKHPLAFIPFGLGVRTCIGQNLAVLQAKLTVAMILQRFSFRLGSSYQHAPTVLMLLYPQHGAPIVFDRLNDDDRDRRL